MMKKLVLLSVLFGALPIMMMAQDDLYFTPKKSDKTVKGTPQAESDAPAYYSGSDRSVDEYNRHGKFGSYFEKIGTDSLGNDIIEFHSGGEDPVDTLAVYPGAKVEYDVDDDYYYSRRMSRFDDFYWYDPWFRGPYYGWHSPWWYSRWGWYDPWYYGYGYNGWYGWYDWYDPYFYSWYGWGSPYRWGWYGGWNYYSRPVYVNLRPASAGYSRSTARYDRGGNYRNRTVTSTRGTYDPRQGTTTYRGDYSSSGRYSSNNVNRGYRRNTTSSSVGTRSSSLGTYSGGTRSSGSFGSGSSAGGSRSGGGFSGGGRSGGGGVSHGGRR